MQIFPHNRIPAWVIKMRSIRGQVSLEVTVIAILLVIFVTLSFNIFVAVWGFTILDSAARDAARAAGAMPTRPAALVAAQQAALAHQTDGYFIGQPRIEDDERDFRFVENPNGTRPSSGSPFVAVTMRSTIRLPVPIDVFGLQFLTGPYDYTRTYVYPIMNGTFAPPVTYIPVDVDSRGERPFRSFSVKKSEPKRGPVNGAVWTDPETAASRPIQHVDPAIGSIDYSNKVTHLPQSEKSSGPIPPSEVSIEAPASPAPPPPATTGGN
ncbi:MAG: hypothetical protein C5B53_04415 [Candidatus Melainabacteria bacterium]|nr:MAG: hypothetical protein C5B53_04415 [Candidatus Melainabacteria bacterium]